MYSWTGPASAWVNGSPLAIRIRVHQNKHAQISGKFALPSGTFYVPNTFDIEGLPGSSMPLLMRAQFGLTTHTMTWDAPGLVQGILARVSWKKTVPDTTLVDVTWWINRQTDAYTDHFLRRPFSIADGNGVQQNWTPSGRPQHHNAVQVTGLPLGQLNDATQSVESVCWLLSYATGGLCAVVHVEAQAGSDVVHEEWRASTPYAAPPYVVPSRQVVDFVRTALPHFEAQAAALKLRELIHLNLLARREHNLTTRALLVAAWLEVLRYNFAMSQPKSYLYDAAHDLFLIRTPGTKKASGKKKDPPATFEQILKDFEHQHKITGWKAAFKVFRNSTMHTGALTVPNLRDQTNEVLEHVDRILLALFDWDKAGGFYVPVTAPVVDTPTRVGTNEVRFAR